ncbi:MAG: 6-phosphofructokinase [Clostridia bacterium]|nr:6-phosphofructokinase [Clostridia bacterium]
MKIKNVGVLTSGGDAPGMNAAVRSVVRCGLASGLNMFAIYDGFKGLLKEQIEPMTTRSVCDIIQRGGTILSTARCIEFVQEEYQKIGADIARKHGLDAIVVIGGDGSFMGARALTRQGVPTIGIPGTIDNDIACSEYTIGYDTALNTAMEAIDKIRDTMTSHSRCCLVEVMGRNAGYLALNVAVATGAETVLIPERPFDFEKDVLEPVREAKQAGKKNHIIVVAEGVDCDVMEMAKKIEAETKVSTRASILGHIQRGGSPTCRDRVTAAQMGQKAIELLLEGKSDRVVRIKDGKIDDIDVNEGLSMQKKAIDEEELKLAGMLAF